jgi:Tfp pilus assembly protein PilN
MTSEESDYMSDAKLSMLLSFIVVIFILIVFAVWFLIRKLTESEDNTDVLGIESMLSKTSRSIEPLSMYNY